MKKNMFLFIVLSLLTLVGYACDSGDSFTGYATPTTPGDEPGTEPEPEVFYEYFVSAAAAEEGDGSLERPFRTIGAAVAAAGPGDIVTVRGGTYSEAVVFPKSGTTAHPITLRAYAGETPLISGRDLAWHGTSFCLVLVSGVSNITVEGFEIADLVIDDSKREVNGVVVNDGATSVTLRNLHIHDIKNLAEDEYPGAHAIHIVGNTSKAVRNAVVTGCRIHDCVTGTSETVTANGYVDGFTISGNEIYRCSNIAIDAAGGYAANSDPSRNYARNGIICDNVLYNIENSLGGRLRDGYGAIAIYADGARNITIERNRIFSSDRGIGIVSETNAYPTTGCIVRNNIVYGCWRTGIYLGGYLNYTTGGTENCYVVNNTLCGNNRIEGHFGEIEGEIRLTENCRNNKILNNLICTTSREDLFVHKYTTTGADNLFANNHYSGPGQWMWESQNGGATADLATWRELSGGDSQAVYEAVPVFSVGEPDAHADFTIDASSSAKNAGQVLPIYFLGTTDFAGNPRVENGKVSIGAIQ